MPTVFPSSLGGPKPQIELADGTPAVGGRLFFYVAGSVGTKTNTYTDSTGASANTNPVVLDALGMPTTTELWMESGVSYKIVYAPPGADDPPSSPIFSVDNLNGIGDTAAATFDQWVAGPAPTFISATQFSLVGDQTATFHVGRRVKTLNTSGEIYSTISTSVFGAVTTITLVNDAGVLDAGLTAVSYGLISYVNTSAPSTVTGTITVTRVNTAIIDSNAAVDISLRTNNGTEQVQINHVASSNRSLVLSGSNGGNPTIGVTAGSLGLTTDTVIGGVLTVNSIAVSGNLTVGGASIPQNSQNAGYTLVAADANKHIYAATAGTFTIPANSSVAFTIGTAVTFTNFTGSNCSIAITTDTLYLGGTATTGTRTLANAGIATALKVNATTWVISGAGLS